MRLVQILFWFGVKNIKLGKYCRLALVKYQCIYSVMRIEGPNKSSSTSSASKTKRSGSTSSASFSALVESMSDKSETTDTADVSGASSVSVVDALLAVQEDGRRGSDSSNKKMQERAESILNRLDAVRNGILRGTISEEQLKEISHIISQKRETDIDPLLSDILDEIDLRAQVELAKLGRI